MRKGGYALMLLFLLSTGCVWEKERADLKLADAQKAAAVNTEAEAAEGDFSYRLITEKEEYDSGEEVQLYAELEYTGALDQVTIYHAFSPFLFSIKEETRGYFISYAMDQPGLSTTLIKGEPLRELYKPTAVYSLDEDEEYVAFMKSFVENGFAAGTYRVKGHTDFTTRRGELAPFKLSAELEFKVK